MRRLALSAALGAAAVLAVAPAPAGAGSAPRVDVMIAGRTAVLAEPVTVRATATRVKVGGRRCRVAAATPLAALDAARRAGGPSFALRDFGACGARAADSSLLFVSRIGGEANRGRDGWVYKLGRRVGSAGAADPTGPFGTGRLLRDGQDLLWFWCRQGARGCQRTLEATPAARTVGAGAPLRVVVRGYDDQGRGVVVAGARVTLGAAEAVTGVDGAATVTAPAAGRHRLVAERSGMVRSFPVEVVVR